MESSHYTQPAEKDAMVENEMKCISTEEDNQGSTYDPHANPSKPMTEMNQVASSTRKAESMSMQSPFSNHQLTDEQEEEASVEKLEVSVNSNQASQLLNCRSLSFAAQEENQS